MAVTISGVQPGSPAEKAGLCAGMRLLSVDGNAINDGLDYEFYTSGARLWLVVEAECGAQRELAVQKDEYQPLGAEFETYLIDRQHHCKNKCVFCFVDQLPQGLRAPLYFKDDDERLGFLFGNYITLTNLEEEQVRRIIKMRFSPVNISVHTVNPELRCRMMGNPGAGRALEIIPGLAEAGIQMNFQLVLCPGLNDGAELRRSIEWLAGFYPATQSIAAVPVGLTRHRQGLEALEAYTAQSAAEQLDIMLEMGDTLLAKQGRRLVYPADEWFLLAGRPVPSEDFYEGYPQLENGVGMWRLLADEFADAMAARLEDAGEAPLPAEAEADIVVGTLVVPLFCEIADRLAQAVPGARLHVHPVVNHFFGPGVTVTGLLTGQDMVAQLRGRLKSGRLLLPEDTLRAEGDMMLDGMTPEELAVALDADVEVVPKGGDNLLAAILDE